MVPHRLFLILLLLAGQARSQSLLGVDATTPPPPAAEVTAPVTLLAQIIATELGTDAPLETQIAFGRAVLNAIDEMDVPGTRPAGTFWIDRKRVYDFRMQNRGVLSRGFDGPAGLGSRDLAWLTANGHANAVRAAQEAPLDDPTRGAIGWILPGRTPPPGPIQVTARFPSASGEIAFYLIPGR